MGQDINKPPFKSNQEKLNDRYGNPINKSNDLKVYSNTSLKPKSSKKDTVSNYYSPISKKISSYQYKLILDSDGAKLLEMYKQIKPQNNEFYIFIEKNDSYNKYGSIFRLKIGSDLEKNKPSFLVKIVKQIDEKIPSIKDDQIDEVLNSLDEDFTHKFFNWIRNVLYESSFTSILESIIDFSEDFILPAVEGMRLDDSRWDTKDIKNYNPLIPIPEILKVKDKSKEKFLELVASKTFQAVDTKISTLSKSIELLSNNKKLLNSKSDVSKSILSKLKEAQEAIQFFKSKIDDIHNFATQLYDTMKVAITKLFLVYLQSLNAMVCGLWNSLIDLIYGIISLPILLGKGVLAVINPKNDLKYYWDYAKELYENFLEANDQIPISEVIGLFFKRSFQEVISIVRFHSERNTLLKFAGNVLVNYSYFCGYLVGFIATLFIEVIFSAGVAAVVDIASKFQKIVQKGASTFTKMSSLIKNEVKNVAEYFKAISILIRRLLGAIQKGKSEFIKMLHKFLDDFWKAVRKSFGVVDEVEQEIWKLLAKFFKTEKIINATNGAEILCFAFNKVLIPVDKILMYARGKVRGVEDLAKLEKEFSNLKNLKQTERKVFDKNPTNITMLGKLKRDIENINKSLNNKKGLEKAGFVDDVQGNKKVFDFVLAIANKNSSKIKQGEWFVTVIKGPKGKITIMTQWQKLENGKLYLKTIKIF